MKKILSFAFIACLLLVTSTTLNAQHDRFAWTITDSVQDGVKWNYLRKLDLRNNVYSDVLLRFLSNAEMSGAGANPALCNGVAALAYDRDNNRLYYTPALYDRLSYIDLRTMRTVIVTNIFTRLMPKAADQSNIFTRMVIDDRGNGYALTNDARHLIRFTTGRRHTITDLGTLADATGNNEVSVHNACTGFGGDLVADDDGNLYLISASNNVFKINIRSKVAKFMGHINGLPEGFSTNGMAVNQSGRFILIASAANPMDVYKLNLRNLTVEGSGVEVPWRTADMANSNILDADRDDRPAPELYVNTEKEAGDNVRIFPNPVAAKEFNVQFLNLPSGKYRISILDIKGDEVLSREINNMGKVNTVKIEIQGHLSGGIYIIRIMDKNNQVVHTGKLIVL